MRRQRDATGRAYGFDAAEFMHLMTVGGSKRHSSSLSRRTASLAGFFDLSHVFDGPLRYGASVRFDTDD